MQLSLRLSAIAGLVTRGNRLVDVGCDHGYLPVSLYLDGKIPGAIAMDVRKGPLSRAQEHISQYGLDAYIETRLSDGLEALKPGEGDTMANMAIEAGAKCALFTPDEKTAEYCDIELNEFQKSLTGDEDATYMKTITYRAEDFVPVMACPSQVDKIKNVSELEGTEIDQVFIGSCTNGRLEDLRAAAEVLKGKKVADYVKLIVTPASRKIYCQAIAEGIMDTLAEAGAMITHPGCGLCCGRAGGILTDGERVVATNNRNFLGRMGTSKVEIYLASPKTAAACAIAGKIVNPEK